MMKQFLPEDPGRLWLLRIRFDRFLFLMLFAIMMDRYTLNPVHEVLGVAAILAFGLHAWVNRNWYSGVIRQVLGQSKVRRKKPCIGRWCVIVPNLLLTLLFAASIVSGIRASQSPLPGRRLTSGGWTSTTARPMSRAPSGRGS